MKKAVMFMLVFLMLLGMVSCGSKGGKASAHAGWYKLYETNEGGSILSEADLADYGLTGYLELREDGKSVFNFADDITEGTWSDTAFTVDGEDFVLKFDGDKVSLEFDDTIMTFVRSTEAEVKANS